MTQRCKVCGDFFLNSGMRGGLCARCRSKVFGEDGPRCHCGSPIRDGLFQCPSCDDDVRSAISREHRRQDKECERLWRESIFQIIRDNYPDIYRLDTPAEFVASMPPAERAAYSWLASEFPALLPTGSRYILTPGEWGNGADWDVMFLAEDGIDELLYKAEWKFGGSGPTNRGGSAMKGGLNAIYFYESHSEELEGWKAATVWCRYFNTFTREERVETFETAVSEKWKL